VRRYRFRDEWSVEAPPESVWELIGDPTTFPHWWPIYREARFLEDRGGVGSRILLTFRVLLPYSLTIVSTVTRADRPFISEGTVEGELQGTFRWTLTPRQGGTQVAFEEEVTTNKRILDFLAPLLSPLFELNHRIAARRGAEGMRAYFLRRPPQPASG
jgi:hypothetical protein